MSDSPLEPNRRILVIDDNPAIHEDFKKILQASPLFAADLDEAGQELFGKASVTPPPVNFQLSFALTGQDGLVRLQAAIARQAPFALVFLDIRMPQGWDGIETAEHIIAADPDIQIVLCTAYADYSWDDIIARLGQSDRLVILKKPFDSVEVVQLAHALTEKWGLRQKAQIRMDHLEQMVAARTRQLETANEQLRKEMEERTRVEEALRQSQKMEALGQLAGGIAHDFNNLITIIRGHAQILLTDRTQKPVVMDALRQMDAAAERAGTLTSRMLIFSRKKHLQRECLKLSNVLTDLGKMIGRVLPEDIALELACPDPNLAVDADRAMMDQIILNLAVNARDAMPQGGRLTIRVTETVITELDIRRNPKARAGRFACIQVSDTGCGIAPEAVSHLFEPFFTTKEPGKGTGLGLATVYGIVKQHEGWIQVESEPGRGASFQIFLPVSVQAPAAATHATPDLADAGGKESILLVEDEAALRRLAFGILRRHGYTVYDAGSGQEACSIWNQHGPKIDLLFTDLIMPGGLSGRDLAKNLRTQKGDLKVVYTTGYSLETIAPDCHLQEGVNFLPKPYQPHQLVKTIRRCLDRALPAGSGSETTLPQ